MEEYEPTSTVAGDPNQDSKDEKKKKKKSPEDTLAVESRTIQPATQHGFDTDSLYPRQDTTISPDHHLLRIIQINVLRGLMQNETCLRRFTSYANFEKPLIACGINPDLDGSSILMLRAPAITTATGTESTQSKDKKKEDYSVLPNALVPTETQRRRIHVKWINTIPFPRMRENLIQWEQHFDHLDFARDVIGAFAEDERKSYRTLAGRYPSFGSGSGPGAGAGAGSDLVDGVSLRHLPVGPALQGDDTLDDEVTTGRKGLILWGEPHRVENWEVTPGFLRKWMWTMEGCNELIESTNRWRRVRGEEPIRIQRWRPQTDFA